MNRVAHLIGFANVGSAIIWKILRDKADKAGEFDWDVAAQNFGTRCGREMQSRKAFQRWIAAARLWVGTPFCPPLTTLTSKAASKFFYGWSYADVGGPRLFYVFQFQTKKAYRGGSLTTHVSFFWSLSLFGRWPKTYAWWWGGRKTTIENLFVQSLQVVCKSHPFHLSNNPRIYKMQVVCMFGLKWTLTTL